MSNLMHNGLELQLRQKIAHLSGENAHLRELMCLDKEVEPDLVDRAWSASSQDFVMIRFNRNAALIKDIELALKSLENDSYGLCEMCGDEIAERRLLAIPSARFCIECQELLDRNPDEFMRVGLGEETLAAV